MLYLSIAALAVVAVCLSLADDRLLKAWAQERAEWARERQVLLQRIQAPEAAVLEHQQATEVVSAVAPHVTFDDDEGFYETKEQLAERVAGVNGGGDD